MKLYHNNHGVLTDIGFNMDLHIRLTPNRPPTLYARFSKMAVDGSFLSFNPDLERFSNRITEKNEFNSTRAATHLDRESPGNINYIMARVLDALPTEIYRMSEDEKIDPTTREILGRIANNLTGDLNNGHSEQKIKFYPHSRQFQASLTDPAVERINIQGGKTSFTIKAPRNHYEKGKTIFLGDGSGTMRGDLLETMIQVFNIVFSEIEKEKILMNNVSNRDLGTTEEISTREFVEKARQMFLGQGATHLQENFLEASKMLGHGGTIVYACDFLPDSLSIGIENWSKADVRSRIFDPLVELLIKNQQRFIGYYIKNDSEQDAPLIQLMQEYAKKANERGDDQLFYITPHSTVDLERHDQLSSIKEFSRRIKELFKKSEEKFGPITTIPIQGLEDLLDFRVNLKDKNGNLIESLDPNNNQARPWEINVPEMNQNKVITFNFEEGIIEGYPVPPGTKDLKIEVFSDQIDVGFDLKPSDIFLLLDASNSMNVEVWSGPTHRWQAQSFINIVLDQLMGVSDEVVDRLIGAGFFNDGVVPDVMFFSGRNQRRDFQRYLNNVIARGGTRLDDNLLSLTGILTDEYLHSRPLRGQDGFRETGVFVITDGMRALPTAVFTPAQVQRMYERGIVIDMLIIGEKFAWDPVMYVPRSQDLFSGPQGFLELSYATGGKFYTFSDALFKISDILNNSPKNQPIEGKLSGLHRVKITAIDQDGKVISDGVYSIQEQGNPAFFKEETNSDMVLQFDGMDIFAWQNEVSDDARSQGIENFSQAVYDAVVNKKDLYVWISNALDESGEVGPGLVKLSYDQLWKLVEKFYGGSSETDQSQSSIRPTSSSPSNTNPQQQDRRGLDTDNLGGIDFKSDQFNILTQGEALDHGQAIDLEALMRNFDPHRVTPTVLYMAPITSPQMILGPN